MKLRIASLAILALIGATQAHAQPGPGDDRRGDRWDDGRGGAISLYPNRDFRGQGFDATREYSNLPRPFNDGAMSLRVRGGAWEVCVDANFRGRCQVVTRDVRDLRAMGMGQMISSVRPARGGGDGGWGGGGPGGPGGGWGGGGGGGGGNYPRGAVVLFSGPDFSGQGFSAGREYSNLPRENNDRSLSLRIEGRGAWEVCSDANFRGRCQIFRNSVPDLRTFGLGEAISSVRPVN